MKMRIAQIAPLYERVPPRFYGGTERVVHVLTEELVSRGHDVTLFATGDSVTSARLVAVTEHGWRIDPLAPNPLTSIELGMVYERAEEFDLIHNHLDYLAFPLARLAMTPTLTTLHGRLDHPRELREVHYAYRELPRVAISQAQRASLPDVTWAATIYNGIFLDHYTLRRHAGEYLAFLGRISPDKRPDRAIEIARTVGMPLRIAAKIDPVDQAYFDSVVRPMMDRGLVEFMGEIGEEAKDDFLGNAYAYLFPIDWPEPFGLTLIEAMATGTPVVAAGCGSVPEIVEDGITGFVGMTIEEMIDGVRRIPEISRERCRARCEERFSAARMAAEYEAVYDTLAGLRPEKISA